MNAKCVCEKCRRVNLVGSGELEKKWVQDKEGQQRIKVTYYECRCGHRNVVQADNAQTEKILKDLCSVIFRVMRQGATNRDRRRRDKKEADLLRKRDEIRLEIVGKSFYDEEGKIFIKDLTFATDGNII